jgi:hypothetical protein
VEFERVDTISMGCVLFQIFGEIDDINGFERAPLDTNTTTCSFARVHSIE